MRSFQVATVLGEKEFLNRPYKRSDGDTKGMGPGSPVPSTGLRPFLIYNSRILMNFVG